MFLFNLFYVSIHVCVCIALGLMLFWSTMQGRRNKEDDTYYSPSLLAIFKFGSQKGSNIGEKQIFLSTFENLQFATFIGYYI